MKSELFEKRTSVIGGALLINIMMKSLEKLGTGIKKYKPEYQIL